MTRETITEGLKLEQKILNDPQTTLGEILRQVPVFSKLPEAKLQWLSQEGEEVWLEPGEIHRSQGDPAEHVFVLLAGEIRVMQKVGEQEVILATYKPKELFGELPILMGEECFWASGRAVSNSHIFELPKDAFWNLLSTCSCVTTSILGTMARRMQEVQILSQQREKLTALGTLAAGLAHELNNPASAARRAARQLRETFEDLQPLTWQLGQQQMPLTPQEFLGEIQRQVPSPATTLPPLDPITQSDLEDELIDWLEAHGVPKGWQLAPTLVEARIDTKWLDALSVRVPPDSLGDLMLWLEKTLTGVELLEQVEQSSERICELVNAVKDYSYMDQAPLQEVDVHEGLESTLTILGHKLKQSVVVSRDYDLNLPRLEAYGSELNQVWTNLIDNAIDAIASRFSNQAINEQGEVRIKTSRDQDRLVVTITDNGLGIPPEIQPHIFEPFFTTKGVGKGTGVGLHLAYGIVVEQHQGDIRVFSQPGETCFEVRLPIKFPQLGIGD
ncbi:MAG: cyclic nucleotide-binding domain-containing protein [Symploca sp. SIO3C6]|uniref:histidine kinase n=1 Tax=Symploca sp. SIO1C4 TaxID=2607765 RepID=A0A6B3NB33_9CYAN|nr:cyclic nucleotide-binding domain-containing protein [Symploca sp. SIO3C6]NER28733.1 cyclic nucleotide-binding domain-containing protein [Symploca sp. SIO1C4]